MYPGAKLVAEFEYGFYFDEESASTDCCYVAFGSSVYERVNYSQYNIIHEVLWYEYIYDEAMNVIEDHCWTGECIYANFQRAVQATEAKRLEKQRIWQCSDFH